jgi:hypothetical protein
VDRRLVNGGWDHPPYRWLARQMRLRGVGSGDRLPWFAYCDRPDLRWVRHTRPYGSPGVLIAFAPPPGTSLTFPCWAWHEVYCGQYLALTGTERVAWDRRERSVLGRGHREPVGPLPAPLQAELEASWLRLFSPELPARSWRRADRRASREAVVEVIRSEWVGGVQEFVGTGAWLKVIFRNGLKRGIAFFCRPQERFIRQD